MFIGNSANYKASVFLSAFDGYSSSGNNLFQINLHLSPIILNINQQTMDINAPSGNCWINYMSYTYIVMDITSFLINLRFQVYGNDYITSVNKIGIE